MKKKKLFSQKIKNAIFNECLKIYKKEPDLLRKILPNVYEKLNNIMKKQIQRGEILTPSPAHSLTESELNLHLEKLNKLIEKYKKGERLSESEGLEIIEHIMSVGIDKIENYDECIDIAGKILNIDFNEEKSKTYNFSKKEISKSGSLICGVDVYLTWDGKVVKISTKKDEIKWRKKAMGFIGIGKEEKQSDVSINHDRYLLNESSV